LTHRGLAGGLNGVEEQNSSAQVTDDMRGGGLDQWFTRRDSSGTNAMLADGSNSTVGLVNSSGSLATQFTYEPFGRTTFSGSGSSNLYRYTGRELDLTGLYFLRARYYNPILQRFLSPDPIGFAGGSPDLYAYAFNSPTNFSDPLGLSAAGTALGAIGGLYGCGGGCPGGDCAGPPPVPPFPGPTPIDIYQVNQINSLPSGSGIGGVNLAILGIPFTQGLVGNSTPGGVPRLIGGVAGATAGFFAGRFLGAAIGGYFFGAPTIGYYVGGAVGTFVGGHLGRWVGGLFDPAGAGSLNYQEPQVPGP
jgi:RHS repeat-associated protein